MKITTLQYFVEIVYQGSINKAAQQLHISQQTLSHALIGLEDELNVKLFVRTNKGIVLTDIGRNIYGFAKQQLKEHQQLLISLAPQQGHHEKITFNLGAPDSAMQMILPKTLSLLKRQDSDFNIIIQKIAVEEIIQRLLTFELDLGIVIFYEKGDECYPALDHNLHFQSLCFAKPYFWLSTKSPLAHQKSITFEEVITYPLIYKEAVDKDILWHILQHNGVTGAEMIESDNVYLIAQLIEDDQGICFDMKNQFGAMGYANIFFQKNIKAIPLSLKEQYNLNIGVAIHRNRLNDIGIQNMIEVLKNNIG